MDLDFFKKFYTKKSILEKRRFPLKNGVRPPFLPFTPWTSWVVAASWSCKHEPCAP